MKEKKYLVLGITLVVLTFVGVSLAYFLTTIEGERKNITINTADLRVIFTNGDAIEGIEIEPGWNVTKTFSVENKSKNEYKYNIVIEDLVNTFKTTGYLQYKITSTDGGYNMTDFEDVPKSLNPTNTGLAFNITIPSKSIQNYSITIQYRNDENVDQSKDALNNAVVTGKLYISEGSYPTLAKLILRDNPTISERTDFSVANTSNTTGTIYQTDKTEDGSTVYYYSGNTTKNWVKFGKKEIEPGCKYNGSTVLYFNGSSAVSVENESQCLSSKICKLGDQYGVGETVTEDFCTSQGAEWTNQNAKWSTSTNIYWRIIRTNEDGSVRLLYAGTNHDTTSGYIGLSKFNENYNDPMYAGYMYGTSGSLENNRTNTNDSTIKTFIDKWYEDTLLTKYDKYISKTAIYCNDRSVKDNLYSTSSKFYYGALTRLNTYNNHLPVPTYKCGGNGTDGLFESAQAIADKFSASTTGGGNGQLKYPIAMMTADELSFAGGLSTTELEKPYAWYYTNSQGESITGTNWWWALSPGGWGDSRAFAWNVRGSGSPGALSYRAVQIGNGVRPSVSLASCADVKSGNGTPESPYEIDYEGSCK